MMRLRGTAVVGGVLGLLLGLVTACGGDEDPPSSAPSSSATASTSPSDSPSDSPSPTDETSASPTTTETASPGVTPATGLELVEKTSAVRAPDGWTKDQAIVKYASSASDPDTSSSVQLVDNVSLTGEDEVTLDEMAEIVLDSLRDDGKVTRLPDVDLAGTPAFRLQYTKRDDPFTYEMISTLREGRAVGIDLILDRRTLKQQPDLVESVLASFRWR